MINPKKNDFIKIIESNGISKYLKEGSFLKVLRVYVHLHDENRAIIKCVINGKIVIVRNWLYKFEIFTN